MIEQGISRGETPAIVAGPLSVEGRQIAVNREIRDALATFYGRSVRSRTWDPTTDLPFDEMKQAGLRLSPDTVSLIEGSWGVEEFVGDYVIEALKGLRGDIVRDWITIRWGYEESLHGIALEEVLRHSGVRSEKQLDDYLDQLSQHRWTASAHHGLSTPIGAAVYQARQERVTYVNYVDLRGRVREEYGLPRTATDWERKRGYQFGAAEAIHKIELDEIAHHGLYLKMVQIYLKYFPVETMEAIKEVMGNFKMPALRLLPNRRAYIRAILGTGLYNEAKDREVAHLPVLKAFGFEDDEALDKAIEEAKAA